MVAPLELLPEPLGWAAQCTPALRCYPAAVLAWRLSTREVTVGRSTIARWEKGENAPNAEQLAALCDVFACRPTVFSKPPQLRK